MVVARLQTGVLCRDCARGDERGGGESGNRLGGQRACSRGDDATGGARSPGARGACSCGGPSRRPRGCPGPSGDVSAAGRGGRAELGEDQLLEHQQRADGEDRGERVVVGLEVLLEVVAAFAVAHMSPCGCAELDQALGHLAELQADFLTAELARLGGLGQGDSGAHQQRLDRRHGGLHRVGDLVVGERVDLAQEQRGALRLGQLLYIGDQLAEALTAENLLAGRDAPFGEVDVHRVHADGRGAAQVVERAVARDPVEPRPHIDLALVGEDRVEGGREDLLQHVLGVLLGGEHVPAEGEQA